MRRWAWLIVAPAPLVLAGLVVMAASGFMTVFSFRGDLPREVEAVVAPLVLLPALALAGFSAGASFLLKRRKAKREPGGVSEAWIVAGEAALVGLAVFFGGFAALAKSHDAWQATALRAAFFLAWAVLIEVPKARQLKRRRFWRLAAFVSTCLATWGLIRRAVFP